MKKSPRRARWVLAIGLAASLAWTASGSAQVAVEAEEEDEFPQFISPDELRRLITEGSDQIVILDNAPTLAWEESHIPGALSFPWVHQIRDPVTFPRSKTLVLYCPCAHDEDSIDMAKKLVQIGYFKIKVLEGGWFKWEDLGYDVVSAADEQKGK